MDMNSIIKKVLCLVAAVGIFIVLANFLSVSNIKKTRFEPGDWQINTAHATSEVRHIAFLKVHKAASSTMQNMFFRFGMKRNATFVFTENPNYFSRNASVHIPLVEPKRRQAGYDILCNHAVFNHSTYTSILPEDSVYLAIVRDPMQVFISGVNYYSQPSQMLPYLSVVPGNKLQRLLQTPDAYDVEFFSYTKNVMARDLGFPATFDSTIAINRLAELDGVFTLVLIVEYLEESLILMRRYLNWQMQDIIFLPNNVYTKQGYTISDLSPNDVEIFKSRNKLDYLVYNFFYEKFWKQFRAEPSDIHMEVLRFKEIMMELNSFCEGTQRQNEAEKADVADATLFIEQSEWNEEFFVSLKDCEYMQKKEEPFITELRKRQGSDLKKEK